MANVTVTIVVKDTAGVPQPVDGVLVQVYDDQDALVTTGVTGDGANDAGERDFTLNGDADGVTYRLRISKVGTTIVSPQDISVTDPVVTTNIFDVSAELHTLPVAASADMCRCSGYFTDVTGKALTDVNISFHPKIEIAEPQIIGGGDNAKAALGRTLNVKTDSTGYIQVDLPRDGEFDVVVGGQENDILHVVVPDASSCSIVHLLWPVILNVTYDPVSPAAVPLAGTLDVALVLTWTSKTTKFDGSAPLIIESSDTDIATATLAGADSTDAKLVITGVKAGQATFTVKRRYETGYEIVSRPALAALPSLVVNVA
jgi:hypothetical protein